MFDDWHDVGGDQADEDFRINEKIARSRSGTAKKKQKPKTVQSCEEFTPIGEGSCLFMLRAEHKRLHQPLKR